MLTETRATQNVAPPLVRWGAVFSGTVIGLSLTLLAGSLWVALAFGSHQRLFYDHLAWWLAGTAIGATFLAALIASAVSGTRGAGAGLATGSTTWGLIVLASVAAGIPSLVSYGSSRAINVNGVRIAVATVKPWTTFWALLIGLGAAAVGGLIGGLGRRRPVVDEVIDAREPVVTEPAVPAEREQTARVHARR